MMIFIPFTNSFDLQDYEKSRFKKFIESYLIHSFTNILNRKKNYLKPYLQALSVKYSDILPKIPQFFRVFYMEDGMVISYVTSIYIYEKSLENIVKSIDYGSSLTGYPKHIFTPILLSIKRNIDKFYVRFLGA